MKTQTTVALTVLGILSLVGCSPSSTPGDPSATRSAGSHGTSSATHSNPLAESDTGKDQPDRSANERGNATSNTDNSAQGAPADTAEEDAEARKLEHAKAQLDQVLESPTAPLEHQYPGELLRVGITNKHQIRIKLPRDGSLTFTLACASWSTADVQLRSLRINGRKPEAPPTWDWQDDHTWETCDSPLFQNLGDLKQGDLLELNVETETQLGEGSVYAVVMYSDGFPAADTDPIIQIVKPPKRTKHHLIHKTINDTNFEGEAQRVTQNGTLSVRVTCDGAAASDVHVEVAVGKKHPWKHAWTADANSELENYVYYDFAGNADEFPVFLASTANQVFEEKALPNRYIAVSRNTCFTRFQTFGEIPVNKGDEVFATIHNPNGGVVAATLEAVITPAK